MSNVYSAICFSSVQINFRRPEPKFSQALNGQFTSIYFYEQVRPIEKVAVTSYKLTIFTLTFLTKLNHG